MKRLLIFIFSLSMIVPSYAGSLYLGATHYSKIFKEDYGVTTLDVGIEGCKKSLCGEASVSTPIGNNDINGYNRNWNTGDVLGGVKIKYKFYNW